jgi:hypothetical protein
MKSSDERMVSVLSMHDEGDGPEAAIVRDLVKRGLFVAPIIVAVCAIFWGVNGALSAGYGLVLVLFNFILSAVIVTYAARISYAILMGATLFGYLFRMAVIAAAVYLVRNESWVELIPLCISIVVLHVGLLFWEMRYISLSLAFPGVKPKKSNLVSTTNGQ